MCCCSGECNGSRPEPNERLFVSKSVDTLINSYLPRFKSPILGKLFENCLPNALDTTVTLASRNSSFIITGDINAMWLRDSTNQLNPYITILADHEVLLQNYPTDDDDYKITLI